MKKINIGLIGLGTIGEGVYKILNSRRSEIKKSYGLELNIKSCCDISPNIAKKLKIKKEYFTNNYTINIGLKRKYHRIFVRFKVSK